MKKLFLLFFMLLCSSFLRTYAATWVQIDENSYIDKDSIKNFSNEFGSINANQKSFWTKYIGKEYYKNCEINNMDYVLTLNIIDYSNDTYSMKTIIVYDKDGKSIASDTVPNHRLHWENIVPDSRGEYYAELVKNPDLLNKLYKNQTQNNK